MHFPSTGFGNQGAAELKSPQLVTIHDRYPQQASPQPADGAWQYPGPGHRCGGYLESNGGEARQQAAGGQQGSAPADIQGSSEFQELLALGVFAANKHRNCKRYAFVFPTLDGRSSWGHLRSWEWTLTEGPHSDCQNEGTRTFDWILPEFSVSLAFASRSDNCKMEAPGRVRNPLPSRGQIVCIFLLDNLILWP